MDKVYMDDPERKRAEEWRKKAGLNTTQMGQAIGMKGRGGWEKWQSGRSQSLHPSNQRRLSDLLATDPKTFNLSAHLSNVETQQFSTIGDPTPVITSDLKALYDAFANPSMNHAAKFRRLFAFVKLVQSERRDFEVFLDKLSNGDAK